MYVCHVWCMVRRPEEGVRSLELELQEVESCLVWCWAPNLERALIFKKTCF